MALETSMLKRYFDLRVVGARYALKGDLNIARVMLHCIVEALSILELVY